ncbi:M1 family metallopeptidase [Furfurilactobacillus sp. WILCCON 0119]
MAEITRFYDQFQPTNYQVFLEIDREQKLISGRTVIMGSAVTPNIAVHQKNLHVTAVKADEVAVPFTVDDSADALNIELSEAGVVGLTITYTAPLTDTMMGIYPSYYNVDGEQKEIIGTQFETTFARQAFPCVDEPEAKATFDLAIKFDEQPGETILSNMPEVRHEDGVHYFDTTMRMSTYLVAFAFGDLQSKQTTTTSGVQVGVFSTKAHKENELDFALDIAKRSIEFYEDFYQTPYPLPHSWQLALPDFSAGAMENWGLVTYREAYLVLDPDNTALATKQLVATVIAHELAHQWFGDLVTMKWWDDLWLNESFANMMEYVAIDALEPEWHIWDSFQAGDVPAALQRDATAGVQSVHVQVNDPAEIDALFDAAIVYAKGARMLVMVRALIGDDALRAGLAAYFEAHHFDNATGADLWAALGTAAKMDVGAIMTSWLEQPGYPVVHAAVVDGQLTISQEQFFIGEKQDAGRLWQIPLSSNYEQVPTLFTQPTQQLGDYEQLRQQNGKPFRLNVGNNAHFVVDYDDTLMTDLLNHPADLDANAQLQLLQDARLLADGQQISSATIIPLLQRFSGSEQAIVTDALNQGANNLKKFVEPETTAETSLQLFFNHLSAGAVSRLGWSAKATDSNDDQLSRPLVLSAALYGQNADAIAAAHQLFTDNEAHLDQLPAAIRPLVLRNEVKHFNRQELFDQLLQAYQDSSDASYKGALCSALTSTTEPTQIAALIAVFENAAVIKPQDLRAWYAGVLSNPAGQQAAWDWLRNDWAWLDKTVGGDMEFATFITVTARAFRTATRLAEFKAFFEPKLTVPGLTREIEMDIKVIEGRVKLIDDEQAAVNDAITTALTQF